MRRLISHDTYASVLGVAYVILITNLLLLVSCLPLVVLLVTTDPALSWPLLAVALGLCGPGVTAAFRAFREHHDGGLGPIRAFGAGLRETWRRSLVFGVALMGVLVVLLVDVRAVSDAAIGVVVVPLLAVLVLIVLAVGLAGFVALAEVPTARYRDIVRAAAYLSLRRWYLTAVSLFGLASQVGVFAASPALGIGVTASAILYLTWANTRYTLRPVLDLDPAPAV